MGGPRVVAKSFMIGVLAGACMLSHPLGLASTWLHCGLQVALAMLSAGLAASMIGRLRRAGEIGAISRSFAAVGAVYALALGLVLADGWQQRTGAEVAVAREAGAVAGLDEMAQALPEDSRRQAREAARAYLRLVVDEEWHSLSQGEAGPRADAALAELRAVYLGSTGDRAGGPLHESSAALLKELGDSRRQRLDDSRREIPPLTWALLYTGAAVTVTLFLLTGTRDRPPFRVMLLAGGLTFALFLAGALHRTFDAALPVQPDAFLSVLEGMDRMRV
jgi:hypothetical protein